MRAALIGVGQAGGRITESIVEFDRRMGFGAVGGALAVNTARADLGALGVDTVLVGEDRVKGHGVGGDNELAAEVMRTDATEAIEALQGRITAAADAVIVVAGLGGGTGSGAAPVLVERLQGIYDRPVYAVCVLPGRDEGAIYHANAGRSLKTLVREADALVLIDNDAWRAEGESLGSGFERVNEEIARRVGLLLASGEATEGVGANVVDSSEIINTLRDGGLAAIGYASAAASPESGENVNAVASLAREALLTDMSLPGATEAGAALLVIAGRPEAIPRKGVERARSWIEQETGSFRVRGGDFPVDDDRLAALVLLGGIEGSDRIDEFMERAVDASRDGADREDPVAALRSDELDDLF